ncbi:pirin family protein [Aestuariivirga sp.]|uniref:pirin family protein n=1 Tax=Aestuariivirga sp. TaxID=2650926 RepID=UPI0039E4D9F1
MSLPHIPDPLPGDAAAADAIETIIVPRVRDLGDFEVRRALPAAQRQMVGPFIFFDQMGPVLMRKGQGVNVRPHPHIGLATVTWLFDGQIYHRDSLGSSQAIAPGELNWMTAGRGIVHSERTAEMELARERKVFGIQSWVALPKEYEETAPAFLHVGSGELPRIEADGLDVRVIAGSLFGASSPVKTLSETFYGEVVMAPGAALPVPVEHEERGLYIAEGQVEVAGQSFESGRLIVFRAGDAITVRTKNGARVMLLGGEPMDGPRHIWWNFVSSSKDRIEAAKNDWKQARFDIVPGDEKEFIPLPS